MVEKSYWSRHVKNMSSGICEQRRHKSINVNKKVSFEN